ncbi:MAG: molybdate ABC transporter substrate-binding protein [Bacillota bacterium]|nr:molybdate ABC transporter substrate-binding protein [Bacillota bacterium]
MQKLINIMLLLFLSILLCSCSSNQETLKKGISGKNVDITVSAAASLADVLNEIKSNYEKENPNTHILLNLGGSGALQQQIIQGAPADLFISAAKKQFDELVQKGLIEKKESTILLSNKLVLITSKANPLMINSFNDLTKNQVKEIAIGTVETVPAGMYTKQTLTGLNLWNTLQKKLVPAKDVRQVLTYVETGSADAGMVYLTDAKISDKVKIVAMANEKLHSPILYPAGVIKTSTHRKEVLQFFHYLKGKQAKRSFEKFGFKALD